MCSMGFEDWLRKAMWGEWFSLAVMLFGSSSPLEEVGMFLYT